MADDLRYAIAACLVLLLFFSIGCNSSEPNPKCVRTVDDMSPIQPQKVVVSPKNDFYFVFQIGNGLEGFDTTEIFGDGRCVITFQTWVNTTRVYRRCNFTLSSLEIRDFEAVLNDAALLTMKREYHANVDDGTLISMRIRTQAFDKHIHCNNFFPPGVESVRRAVNERVHGPHQASITAAPIVDSSPNEIEQLFH